MASQSKPAADWLQERIKKAIEDEIAKEAELAVLAAADRVVTRIPEITAKIAVDVLAMVEFHRTGTDLRVTIKNQSGCTDPAQEVVE
jgi:hypothetical protein